MKLLVRIGRKPHAIDRNKYGVARLALFWADWRFVQPGLYLWTGTRNLRRNPDQETGL